MQYRRFNSNKKYCTVAVTSDSASQGAQLSLLLKPRINLILLIIQ